MFFYSFKWRTESQETIIERRHRLIDLLWFMSMHLTRLNVNISLMERLIGNFQSINKKKNDFNSIPSKQFSTMSPWATLNINHLWVRVRYFFLVIYTISHMTRWYSIFFSRMIKRQNAALDGHKMQKKKKKNYYVNK